MSIRTASQLGAAVRQQRKSLGLSQADLARLIGTSRQWVIELEKGHPRAELSSVLRAISELGLLLQIYIENPKKARRSSPDIDEIVASAKRKTA
jgi:HTH-type transcriptional regulator/antitoxin HipB